MNQSNLRQLAKTFNFPIIEIAVDTSMNISTIDLDKFKDEIEAIPQSVCFTCGHPSAFDECVFCTVQRERVEARDYKNNLSPETKEKLRCLRSIYS